MSDEIPLIGEEEMNNAICILKPGSVISVGNKKRGYTITIGSEGILPEDSKLFLDKVDGFHNSLQDLSISNIEENITRNEQLRISNGIDIELKDKKTRDMEPVNTLRMAISGDYDRRIKNNNDDNSQLRIVILGWRNSVSKELDEKNAERNRIKQEKAAIYRKKRDDEILEVKRKADIVEKEKKVKIEERQKAEREVIEKERELSKIDKEIGATKEKKEKSGNGNVEKELDSLEQQKVTVISDIEVAKNNLEDKRDEARSVAISALCMKGELQKLKTEPIVIESVPIEEMVEVKGVYVATYTEWEVENIDMVPDELTDTIRVINAEKVNKAFEKNGGYYDIPGIKIIKKQILRASPKYPDEI